MKHPRELGFERGYRIRVDNSGAVTEFEHLNVSTKQASVYIAIRDDGVCVKVGKIGTTNSLRGRWQRVFNMLGPMPLAGLRQNESNDSKKLRRLLLGYSFEIWFRPSSTYTVNLCDEFGSYELAIGDAEEEYLDAYYRPQFGKLLGLRKRLNGS
jgi:hypothetical protein